MSDFETDAEDEPASPGEHECTMYTCITVCCGVGHMSSLVVAVGATSPNAQTAPNMPSLNGARWRH